MIISMDAEDHVVKSSTFRINRLGEGSFLHTAEATREDPGKPAVSVYN